jgi:hypothetical protein
MISWKTFAVTFLRIESQVDTQTSFPTAPFYQFDKVQFTGTLNESGDRMEVTEAVITNFNEKGELIGDPLRFQAKLTAYALRWRYCPVPLSACPFQQPPSSVLRQRWVLWG